MRRGVFLLGGLVGLTGLMGLGFVPWPVAGPVQAFCRRLEGRSGWRAEVGEARWIPWRNLELRDLKLQTPEGGKLHVVRAWVSPRLGALLKGELMTDWSIGWIRLDPGSWGIRKPSAEELLTSGPVTTSGSAAVKFSTQGVNLKRLSLYGPLLWLEGQGRLSRGRQAHLHLEGALERRLLGGMGLLEPMGGPVEPSWEPFRLWLEGTSDQPELVFRSNFLSLSVGLPLERNR